MKTFLKTFLIVCSAAISLSTGLATLDAQAPAPAAPQGRGAGAPGQAAPAPVMVTTTKFGNNFIAIDGQGGRMGALYGPDGVFIVDAQSAAITDRLVAAIRAAAGADARLRLLVNTHVHGDHTGGNENFGKLGVTLISRPQLRARLANPPAPAPGANPVQPAPALALATVTFDERTTIHMNGEAIELIPLRQAHTDGDTAVRFPVANVLMTGDVFRSVGYPNIDRANGGSIRLIDALTLLADLAGPATTVLPGHGPITNRAAIVAHRDMAVAVRDRVAKLISQSQTMEQIVAAKPTADFDERTGNAMQSADRFVQQLFAELSAR